MSVDLNNSNSASKMRKQIGILNPKSDTRPSIGPPAPVFGNTLEVPKVADIRSPEPAKAR